MLAGKASGQHWPGGTWSWALMRAVVLVFLPPRSRITRIERSGQRSGAALEAAGKWSGLRAPSARIAQRAGEKSRLALNTLAHRAYVWVGAAGCSEQQTSRR